MAFARTLFFLPSLFLALLLMSRPSWGDQPIALIYNGPGTCKGCPETVADRMVGLGYKVEYVGAKSQGRKVEITAAKLAQAAIYIQPGGDDILATTLNAMTEAEKENIRQYVKGCGTYLGLCAGGYIAGDHTLDLGKKIPALGLIQCYVVDEDLSKKRAIARWEKIQWRHHGYIEGPRTERNVYFQDGPKFCQSGSPDQKIYATYKNGDVAAMTASYGCGRVGVIGPHPEADADWFTEDPAHLHVPKKLSHDLFNEMVRDIVPSTSAPGASKSVPGAATRTAD